MSGNNGQLVDVDRLASFMDGVGLAAGAALRVERITTGHSNEVFRVERGDLRLALRRPPRTPLSPTAHDMAREYRLLTAFSNPDGWRAHEPVPVPRVRALCTDPDVIGAPFYLMDLVDGVVVRDRIPDELRADPSAGRTCAFALIDALVAIHAFDWRAGGLEDFGRPDGYLERQVPRWLGQLERYKTRDLPEVDAAGRWLLANTPEMQPPTVIHGDYKLDNVMFAPRLPVDLVAVVDWEQSTVADPLADLGWVLGLWTDPGDADLYGGASPLAETVGAPTRAELAQRYADGSGRDVTHLAFYCVLGLFKLACVMEGSYARFKAGTSDDAYFAMLADGVPALARRALEFTHSS
ncbi:MAG: putative aminoglycoside phosphotransferase [Actinomycetia bacterium]|nr:putative aminoglycoside phosphotransferase [Actinomycetes bacterium]